MPRPRRAPAIDSAPGGDPPKAGSGEVPATGTEGRRAARRHGRAAPRLASSWPGQGLPASVVSAYAADKTVVLLVLKHRGIDDDQMRRNVEAAARGEAIWRCSSRTPAAVARYSRIAQGVDLNRVPALIALATATPDARDADGDRLLRLPRAGKRRPGDQATPSTRARTSLPVLPEVIRGAER